LKQPDDQKDQRDNQQDINECAKHVGNQTKKPKNQKDNYDNPEQLHDDLLVITYSPGVKLASLLFSRIFQV